MIFQTREEIARRRKEKPLSKKELLKRWHGMTETEKRVCLYATNRLQNLREYNTNGEKVRTQSSAEQARTASRNGNRYRRRRTPSLEGLISVYMSSSFEILKRAYKWRTRTNYHKNKQRREQLSGGGTSVPSQSPDQNSNKAKEKKKEQE